jgi:branched-chain amino acid transport system substrate-binding protein
MIPLAGSLKIPVMATGAGATVKTWNPYTYRINVTPPVADPAMMKLLVQKFNIKRLAIIYDETNDGQTTDANIFSDLASSLGYTVVSKQAFKSGDTDVRAQLTSIKAANPDWVAYDAQITDLGLVVNQATEVGLGNLPKLTGFSQWDDPTTWDLTKGAVNGGYSWAPSKDPSSSDADIQAYDTMYKAATGELPTKDSLYGHDVVDLYVNAVKQSCTATDRVKFNDALHKTSNFNGLSGTISFDPTMADGENHAPAIKVTKTVGKGMSVAVTQ